MAGAGLTDPPARQVIDAYLADLSGLLAGPSAARAAILAELEDGLWAATGRRVGLGLLLTGPMVGTSWLLMAAATWAGRRPPIALGLVAALVGLVLVVAIPAAVLSVAASGRLARWLPAGRRLVPTAAAVAAGACMVADSALLAGLLAWTVLGGGVVWPAALWAATVSSARLSLAGRAARRCLAARAALA
jgi:hypothetical protein